jgi:HPt (histidine-containing phosphotransfer) domain-containing protein
MPASAEGPNPILSIDRSILAELFEIMGPDAFGAALASFDADLETSRAALETAAAAGDMAALRRTAHRIKGILSQCGAPGAAALAHEAEVAQDRELPHLATRLGATLPAAMAEVRRAAAGLAAES